MTVAAKRVQVSDDAFANAYTMPGNTGSLQDSAGNVDDTVFGQAYKSNQPTSIDGKITCNSFYKGFAGYVATLKKTGTSTLMTAEAMTLVSGKTYRITNAAKRVIDPDAAYTVLDNAVDHTADVLSIDFLFGTVTFKTAYTPTTPITITANYLPLAVIAKSNSFTLTQTAEATDTSDFETLQNNSGHKTFQQGLKTVELTVKGFYDAANDLQADLEARTLLVVELAPDGFTGSVGSVARGFFRNQDLNLTGNVGAIEESTVKFGLSVPSEDLMELPFRWVHTSSTLPTAIVKSLTAWETGDLLGVRYLPDGTTGYEAAETVVTEMTINGGVDSMNIFSCGFQISGAAVAYP